ncbi:hypothetical protein ACNS7O_08215 [Haloferacaceae archaeon DSL9]
MGSDKLTDADRRILGELVAGPATADELASGAAPSLGRATTDERLAFMRENGLVREAGSAYELTESGRQVLAAPATGGADDRIDVPAEVERALGGRALRADRAASVRAAFAFLRYWGSATGSEIRDAVYSERPGGYEDRHRWWIDCLDPALRALPRIEPPDAPEGEWRYDGEPGVESGTDDGRERLGEAGPSGSARHALARRPLSDAERAAARSAFVALERSGAAETEALVDAASQTRVDSDNDAIETNALTTALESIPGVDRDGGRWSYRSTGTEPVRDPQ